MSDLIFKCSNISKSFDQGNKTVEVLKNIDFTLEQSTSVSIVGPSGSGKTTFLNVLSGLDSPSAGKVFYKEKDINNLNDKERASIRNKEIGFVYQFHHLLPEFTALENVSLPMLISGIQSEKALEKSNYLLKRVNLNNRVNHKPSELSGGERQRLVLARALLRHPEILILDEATSDLDPLTQSVRNMKLPFGHVYRDLICNNFDNILQSIVGFGTFTAYTNDTRFNWAYPSNTATEDDVIPVSTIKLITSVAATVYLIANIPGNVNTTNLKAGNPMADSLKTKLIYVVLTLALLTMGSMGIGFHLNPLKGKEKLTEEANAALPEELQGETKWYLANDKWMIGLAFLTVINFVGIGMPLFTSKSLGTYKIPIAIISSLIVPCLCGAMALSADKNYYEQAIKEGVKEC